jgi:EAL domain-containing protein (putative c-di-GMP-specific phosphodiesterase class I)
MLDAESIDTEEDALDGLGNWDEDFLEKSNQDVEGVSDEEELHKNLYAGDGDDPIGPVLSTEDEIYGSTGIEDFSDQDADEVSDVFYNDDVISHNDAVSELDVARSDMFTEATSSLPPPLDDDDDFSDEDVEQKASSKKFEDNEEFDEIQLEDFSSSEDADNEDDEDFDNNKVLERCGLRLQPILGFPGLKPKYFEALAFLTDKGGEVYDMEQYFGDHVRERIIPQIDMIALTRSVSMLHQLKSSGQDMGIFVNISQYSLISETYLGNILEILDESPSLKNRLFIELSQECITNITPHARRALERIRKLGFSFSLDHVDDWSIDMDALSTYGFSFLKLSAEDFLLRVSGDSEKTVRFTKALEEIGLYLIVEKVETKKILHDVIEAKAPFGQGYALAKPRVIK